MAFDSTKPNTAQTIGDVITSTRSNLADLDSRDVAHEADVTAAHGLAAILTQQADTVTHKANSTTAHGINTIAASAAAAQAEVTTARGSLTTLDTRLSVGMQANGVIKLSSIASKWLDNGDVPTYLTTTTFSVPSDRTKVYIAGTILRCTVSASYVYAAVASCSFGSGITTVVLDPLYPVLTSGLSKVEIALIAWDNSVSNAVTANSASITNLQAQITALSAPNKNNFIVNGACEVATRAAPNITTAALYGQVDRFAAWADATVSAGTIAQDAASTIGIKQNALQLAGVTRTGAGSVYVRHRVEAAAARALKNRTASVSLRVLHDVGSSVNYTITVNKATVADNFTSVTLIQASGSLAAASATETLLVLNGIAMGDCANGVEVIISAACGAVTTKNFRFTDFKIEEGALATAFVAGGYNEELLACRYFYREYGGGNVFEVVAAGFTPTTTTAGCVLTYPRMRIAPTITVSAAANFAVLANAGAVTAATALAASAVTRDGASLDVTVASGLTVGAGTVLKANNTTSARLYLSAEL